MERTEVLRRNAMVNAENPRLEVGEDEMAPSAGASAAQLTALACEEAAAQETLQGLAEV